MAPIFSALSSRPRRIPLSMVSSPYSNSQLPYDSSSYQRASPYMRQLFSYYMANLDGAAKAAPAETTTAAFSPLRPSALTNFFLTLPCRVGPYELMRPWADEVDWFEARIVESDVKVLCKMRRPNDECAAGVSHAEIRLTGQDFVNPIIEVYLKTLPVIPKGAAGCPDTTSSDEAEYSFFFYPYLDYTHCLHTYVEVNKRIPEEAARRLFSKICDMVRSSHEAGVALRDLKMRRLVWREDCTQGFMLASLDNCTVFDADKGDGCAFENRATPSYLSPEMCRRPALRSGPNCPNPNSNGSSLCKVDVWCLGIILFAMVMGRYPFYDKDSRQLMLKVAACKLGPLDQNFSPDLQSMLRMLLHVDPLLRPDIHAVLCHPWLKKTAAESRIVPGMSASK